jgi:hypothetical protein
VTAVPIVHVWGVLGVATAKLVSATFYIALVTLAGRRLVNASR